MMAFSCRTAPMPRYHRCLTALALLLALCFAAAARADEPWARSRDYDLFHSKVAFRFDLEHKKVLGDVTHSLSVLRDGASQIVFDSEGLAIQSVTVNKAAARFETTKDKLIISLASAAHAGEKFDVQIKYEGKPSRGMYFILPDKDYPDRPRQIWTQGESEDTHAYLPTYDYPNDRLTTETILTVPASWITISNGKLVSVSDAGSGLKTWIWKESVPSSTYLFTVVAGEFDEVKDSWRGIPVTYYAPKGRGDRLAINYSRTPAMIELFSRKLGVDYPWEKYSQVMVDDFVAGGMENSSATTNTSSSLIHPQLAPEYITGQDPLISHELGHQWFGDLVTCKDWGHVWLNEGFATFMETLWAENHFPKEESEYERWANAREWFGQSGLFGKPIVRHDFDDSSEFDGNSYTKGGWVLYMLRHQIGEQNFYRGLKRYLEVNRGKNVVTADLVKAIEEATHINVDQFFSQWIYGAGAPQFDLAYAYNDGKHEVALTVKQIQKRSGPVGLFRIPAEVEITTASGAHTYPAVVSKESEVLTFPADSAPLMVLFDKGGHVLKAADFHKEKKEWLYQLKNALEFADRADAAVALGKIKNDDDVVSALGEASRGDRAWGIRAGAAEALGDIGSPAAAKQLLAALEVAIEPWVRSNVISALGNFKSDAAIAAKLQSVAREDKSYRARAAALQALGKVKATGALETLSASIAADSPENFVRNAALRALGPLGDDKAVPLLLEWSAAGKPIDTRQAAISSLARLQKDNHEITQKLAALTGEPHFPVRLSAVFALGSRGDATAIPTLEALLKSSDLSIAFAPYIKEQIARLQKPGKPGADGDSDSAEPGSSADAADNAALASRLDKLERLILEMSTHLKSIEDRLPPKK